MQAQVGPEIDSTALAQMPYADATIKEVLRFETIVPEVYRRALKTFECGGYTFPKVCSQPCVMPHMVACVSSETVGTCTQTT